MIESSGLTELLTATLYDDESASEATSTEFISGPTETRQRSIRESTEKQQAAFTERNMTAMKSFMFPGADENNGLLNSSIINKNNAIAEESSNSALYYKSMTSTEEAKENNYEIKTLTDINAILRCNPLSLMLIN